MRYLIFNRQILLKESVWTDRSMRHILHRSVSPLPELLSSMHKVHPVS